MRQLPLLSNGLTVILDPFEHRTVAVAYGCHGGYRHDPRSGPGESHRLEHPLVRATRVHPSWEQFTRYYENFSTHPEATTDATGIVLSPESIRRHARKLIHLVAEIVTSPLLVAAEIKPELERLREESGDEDDSSKDTMLAQLFSALGIAWQDGRPKDSAAAIARRLRSLHRSRFTGQNSVLVVAGGFDPALIEPVIREAFSAVPPGSRLALPMKNWRQLRGRMMIHRTADTKVSLSLAFPTPGFTDPSRIAIGLLRNHLSARMSSRYGLRLDSVGHGYSALNDLMFWNDYGYFVPVETSIYPEKIERTLNIIGDELARSKRELISTQDLQLAKNNLEVRAGIRFSQPAQVARFYAEQWINLGRTISLRDYLRPMRQVTRHQLRSAAQDIFVKRRLIFIGRGPIPRRLTKDVCQSALGF